MAQYDEFQEFQFSDDAKTIQFVKEKADDIEKAMIPAGPVVTLRFPSGQVQSINNVGMLLYTRDKVMTITREIAEQVLNDGILNRMGIKIELFREP